MSNDFFRSNTIQNYQTLQSSCLDTMKIKLKSTERLKRVASCGTTSKLNPQKFIKREAFNNRLYSQKPFNIAVQFNKQRQEELTRFYSFQESFAFNALKKALKKQINHQFCASIQNVSHHFKAIYQQMNQANDKNQNSIKRQLILLKQSFQKVLKVLNSQIQSKQSKYLALMFSKKAEINQDGNSDLRNQKNLTLRYRKSQNEVLATPRHVYTSGRSLGMNSFAKIPQKKDQISKYNYEQRLKTLNQKIRILEFQNPKQILRIQSCEEDKLKKQGQIKSLELKISQMGQKIVKVNEIEQFYTYKIKKLKEELQVAHIVKEQNLAQKMKYILQNEPI